MWKDASENPTALNIRVGKVVTDQCALRRCCSRLKSEKAATQSKSRTADKLQGFSYTEEISDVRRKEIKSLQMMMRSSAHCRKQSKVVRKRTIKEVTDFTNITCRTSR